jgi:hypothetical protein
MIELSAETIFPSLAAAADSLPGRPHVNTLHRWRIRGIHGIKLETGLIGGRRVTSAEALQRFFIAVTAAANGESPPNSGRTMKERARSIAQAEREFDANYVKNRPASSSRDGAQPGPS